MISAVVINWNGAPRLPGCLEALAAQEPPPDEILLVDNHSDDGSRELVAARFPDVRIVDTGGNLGPAAARNVGVRCARYSMCLLVDNDVVLQPDALRVLRRDLERDPATVAVQARSVCGDDESLVHYDWSEIHVLGLLVLHNWFRPLVGASEPPHGGGERSRGSGGGEVGAFIALCVLVDRAAYERAGGFFDPLFILFEDNELSFRLRALGGRIRVAPDARCVHHGGTAGLSMRGEGAAYPAKRTFLHARNRWVFLAATLRGRTFWATMPVQLLYDGVHLVFSAMRGPAHVGAWLRGHVAALRLLGRARRRRRDLEALRTVPDGELLVAGPLTPNPGLAERGPRLVLRRILEVCVQVQWALVRGVGIAGARGGNRRA